MVDVQSILFLALQELNGQAILTAAETCRSTHLSVNHYTHNYIPYKHLYSYKSD